MNENILRLTAPRNTRLTKLKELAARYKAGFPGGGGGAAEGTLTKDQISQLIVEALSLEIDMPEELDGANTTQLTTQRKIVNAILAAP
jgi:hypothetical protein